MQLSVLHAGLKNFLQAAEKRNPPPLQLSGEFAVLSSLVSPTPPVSSEN